jgi:hypothetical protein
MFNTELCEYFPAMAIQVRVIFKATKELNLQVRDDVVVFLRPFPLYKM